MRWLRITILVICGVVSGPSRAADAEDPKKLGDYYMGFSAAFFNLSEHFVLRQPESMGTFRAGFRQYSRTKDDRPLDLDFSLSTIGTDNEQLDNELYAYGKGRLWFPGQDPSYWYSLYLSLSVPIGSDAPKATPLDRSVFELGGGIEKDFDLIKMAFDLGFTSEGDVDQRFGSETYRTEVPLQVNAYFKIAHETERAKLGLFADYVTTLGSENQVKVRDRVIAQSGSYSLLTVGPLGSYSVNERFEVFTQIRFIIARSTVYGTRRVDFSDLARVHHYGGGEGTWLLGLRFWF